ncbi:hypothetical protein [Falsiroseomonas sp.]|uniref:hypothetical protein n=1 Tax=Falsiroseomonas sp. TaxID=2870721 RepID=UPI0034A1B66E
MSHHMPVGQDGAQQDRNGSTRAAGGDNHARRLRAIALAAALGCALGQPAAPRAQGGPEASSAPASETPLVQRNIPAEATADNAVLARDRALLAGQRIAYERMAASLGLPANASDGDIQALVASLVIESERITPRGYAARITVNFNPPGGATGPLATQVPPPVPGATPQGPAVANLEALALYRSLPEYGDLTRRLAAQPAVARVEIVSITGQQARLRLALRSQPQEAAAEMARGGLLLGPGAAGEEWRLGLAGGR